jgi:hypothetical protein
MEVPLLSHFFLVTGLFQLYLIKSTSNEAPRYAVSLILTSFYLSLVQISPQHSVLKCIHSMYFGYCDIKYYPHIKPKTFLKNGIFWDVTPCGSCKNRRFGGTSRLHHHSERISEIGTPLAVISEVSTAETMKNGVFWDVTPCGSCRHRHFGGTSRFQHHSERISEIGTSSKI